jgi:mRNA-degrading endonuclease RelE of RelBE toxin-antitoxin system
LNAIEVQLSDQPDQQTRKKKKLEENALAPWELRVGDFRVFYDIDLEKRLVIIVAIGKKNHNILRIADNEVLL